MNIKALFKLGYGVYVVTSKKGDRINGQIANTVFQVTAEPPQIAISCHKDNTSAKVIEQSKVFSISVLEKDTDAGLIGLFGYQSGNEEAKFDRVNYKIGETKAPVFLDHTTAYLEAEVVKNVDVGTHTIFIGKIVAAELLMKIHAP